MNSSHEINPEYRGWMSRFISSVKASKEAVPIQFNPQGVELRQAGFYPIMVEAMGGVVSISRWGSKESPSKIDHFDLELETIQRASAFALELLDDPIAL